MSGLDVLFVAGLLVIGSFALFSARWSPWGVMITGVLITVLGAAWGLGIAGPWLMFPPQLASGYSQVFLGFSSVVGGALVGAAFVELRQSRQKAPAK